MEAKSFSRRSFLRGTGIGAAGLGVASMGLAGLVGCGPQSPKAYTYADTIAWNAEYDVVVVGFGGAGGVSSIYAADAGARVLLCDVAPEGEEGGNTRYAAQMCVSGDDPEKLYSYYQGLSWKFNYDAEMLRTYTDGLYKMRDLMAYLGAKEPHVWPNTGRITTPEYPEYKGGDTVVELFVREGMYNSSLWQTIRSNVMDRLDAIDVWYESPAVRLIQDPQSRTIVGVEINKKGETVLVQAKNGVVLTCGGFENNPEMIQNYIGAARLAPFGSLYNKGDGIHMAIEVGASLWHMEAFESLGILSGNAWAVEDGHRVLLEKVSTPGLSPLISLDSGEYGNGSVFLVGDDGGRFINENAYHRHGHVYSNGVWRMPTANYAPHLIFDQTQYDTFKELGYITEDRLKYISSANTPEELAGLIGANPKVLAQTVADFNSFAENGRDIVHGRNPKSMRAFAGDTLYAAEFRAAILNTQGGPRRNKNAEVIDTKGQPIPHLFSAGEFGGICAFQYNSGGNLAECMVFGKIAGTNAATAKDPIPSFEAPQAVDSDIKYQPGEANDGSKEEVAVELGANEYLGVGNNGMGGDITVKVAYEGGTIKKVEVVSEKETPEIGGVAIKTLTEAVVAANSASVDAVSGATVTSTAFLAAVNNALEKA